MIRIRIGNKANGKAEIAIESRIYSTTNATETVRYTSTAWLISIEREFQDLLRRAVHASAVGHKLKFAERLKEVGKSFADLIIPPLYQKEVFRPSEREPVVFSVDHEFGNLPFEILSDGFTFLSDERPVIRTLRISQHRYTLEEPRRIGEGKLIFMPVSAIQASPVFESAVSERAALMDIIEKKGWRILDRDLLFSGLRRLKFLQNLMKARYVHFAGHSTDEVIWLGTDEKVMARDISSLELAGVELVFLNSCESSRHNVRGDLVTFNHAFLQAGVRNYIGYTCRVPNLVSEVLARAFWQNIVKGESIHISLFRAKQQLQAIDAGIFRFACQHFGEFQERESKYRISPGIVAMSLFFVLLLFVASNRVRNMGDTRPMPDSINGLSSKNMASGKAKSGTSSNSLANLNEMNANRREKGLVRNWIESFASFSLNSQFSSGEVKVMTSLFKHIEANRDHKNYACEANIANGNKEAGKTPISRRQILRNLLLFRCVKEAPIDWDCSDPRKPDSLACCH